MHMQLMLMIAADTRNKCASLLIEGMILNKHSKLIGQNI